MGGLSGLVVTTSLLSSQPGVSCMGERSPALAQNKAHSCKLSPGAQMVPGLISDTVGPPTACAGANCGRRRPDGLSRNWHGLRRRCIFVATLARWLLCKADDPSGHLGMATWRRCLWPLQSCGHFARVVALARLTALGIAYKWHVTFVLLISVFVNSARLHVVWCYFLQIHAIFLNDRLRHIV